MGTSRCAETKSRGAVARRVRALACSAFIPFLALVLSGCTFIVGEIRGPDDYESLANGIDAEVGPVEIRSLLIIARYEGGKGRFLGDIFNNSDSPVVVVLSDDDEKVSVTVPVEGSYSFSENFDGLQTVSDIPGARLPLTVTVGSASARILPIILDGSLEQYEQFAPTG